MDLVDEWAIKIAEAVAPDEIDLAPLTAQAFLSGGKNKGALFQTPTGGVPGAFDPTGAAVPVLPWILDAIAHAAPVLYHILGAATVEVSLYIHKWLSQKQEAQPPPHAVYGQLKTFNDAFTSKLQPLGLPPEQYERIAYHALVTLLEDPSNAKSFIKRIEGSS